ncbi:MAG: ParB N-terminal domain-containing protein [Bacteroidetes bacterium]|nr:ParB N-terminal domain-containing protein [Bacteroidota bacterium]
MIPRDFFPNMPDELFEDWLEPIIEKKGWPFTSIDDDLKETDFLYIFGLDNTFRDWCTCEWELREVDLQQTKLTDGSVRMISAIITHCVHGKQSSTSNVEKSSERFNACVSYIKEHGNIPKPIVLQPGDESYFLMDGNHRLSALLYLNMVATTKVPAWVASLSMRE